MVFERGHIDVDDMRFGRQTELLDPVLFVDKKGLSDFLLSRDHRIDTWSLRARKNLDANVTGLQQSHLYTSFDRYKRAVADVNRVLAGGGQAHGRMGI